MSDETHRVFPMIVLLLDRVRHVGTEDVSRVVRAELGEAAATTVWKPGGNSADMEYIGWKLGATPYHLGTCSAPYKSVAGDGNVDGENKRASPLKGAVHEGASPEDESLGRAWMLHVAWMYVDAVPHEGTPEGDQLHLNNVLKIASHFVDDTCVLLWHWGSKPKRVALPSRQAIDSLRAGVWPI